MKFPQMLHVTMEKENDGEPYLIAHLGGVQELEDEGPVAIYKLVETGRVQISKKFVGKSSR